MVADEHLGAEASFSGFANETRFRRFSLTDQRIVSVTLVVLYFTCIINVNRMEYAILIYTVYVNLCSLVTGMHKDSVSKYNTIQ